jgi:predicted transcriptional regulator
MKNINPESKWMEIVNLKFSIIHELTQNHVKVSYLSKKYSIDKRTVHRFIKNLESTGWKISKMNASYKIENASPEFIKSIGNLYKSIQNGKTDD